jgi:hypothetical protein
MSPAAILPQARDGAAHPGRLSTLIGGGHAHRHAARPARPDGHATARLRTME